MAEDLEADDAESPDRSTKPDDVAVASRPKGAPGSTTVGDVIRRAGATASLTGAVRRAAMPTTSSLLANSLKNADTGASILNRLHAQTRLPSRTAADLASKHVVRLPVGTTHPISAAALGLTMRPKSKFSVLPNPTFEMSEVTQLRTIWAQHLAVSAGLTSMIARDTFASTWRESLLTQVTAQSLVGTMKVPVLHSRLLADIIAVNTATTSIVARYAEQNRSSLLHPVVSQGPTHELRSLLERLPAEPTGSDLARASYASRGVAGLTAADLLTTDGAVDADAAEELGGDVVDPWVTGPQDMRDLLFTRLAGLDPLIPDFIRAAWIQVTQDGPAAVSLAANAVIESVDRTLRTAAPHADVLAAADRGELGKGSTYEKGGNLAPTRRGRIVFILGPGRKDEAAMVAAQVEALAASMKHVMGVLQSAKHTSNVELNLVKTYLMAAEAILIQLLIAPATT